MNDMPHILRQQLHDEFDKLIVTMYKHDTIKLPQTIELRVTTHAMDPYGNPGPAEVFIHWSIKLLKKEESSRLFAGSMKVWSEEKCYLSPPKESANETEDPV